MISRLFGCYVWCWCNFLYRSVAAYSVIGGKDLGVDTNIILQEIQVASLLTEYLESPLGIDEAVPRVSWQLHAKEINAGNERIRRDVHQIAYQLHVSTSITPEFKDCGWVISNETSLVPLDCHGITPISTSDIDVSWKVSVKLDDDSMIKSDTSFFRTGIFGPWDAKWIKGSSGQFHGSDRHRTLFRKEFRLTPPKIDTVKKRVKHHATLFVAGIGYNHVFINGVKVGDHELDPGWTNYTKRVWYSTYDVTHLLAFEERVDEDFDRTNNIIAVMLGNGWWSCGPSPGTGMGYCSDDPPQLILQLHVDGQPVLVTDETWLTSSNSPIVYNSLYNGEIYDARIAENMRGWKTLNFDDTDWESASFSINNASRALLASQLFEPIRHISTRPPISIAVRNDGKDNITQVFDFGQNQAGVVRLKHFLCSPGSTIVMRHAELLIHPPYGVYDNTTIYVDNLREAKSTDIYICSGDPSGESYTPYFTQHGFRYVEITGLNYTLDPGDLEAVELHSDVKQTSFMEFSNPLLNQIQSMVLWGLKSNFMSVQTDCDQRDERKGWMGDAALTAEAAALSYGMGAFYTHWLTQMRENQNPEDGSMPDIVPPMGRIEGAPNWQTAYPTILWVMMTYYGDRQIIYRHHDALVRYFDFLEYSYETTGLKHFRTGYGDWVPPTPHPTSDKHLMGAFAFLADLQLGIDIFLYSDHPESGDQVVRLTNLQNKASSEFHGAFFNETSGVYMSGLQTEQALPLYLDVVPGDIKDSILSYLVHDIQVTNEGHTTSGIIGIKYVMETLSKLGRGDVALDLALQTTYPSWGYMIHSRYEPATTVWELWQSDFAGPSMNSRNHHMFGSITGWFYKYVGGIRVLDPGFSRVHIQPNLLRHDHFKTRILTPHGTLSMNYAKLRNESTDDGSVDFVYDIVLPPCTRGVFLVPIAIHDGIPKNTTKNDDWNIDVYESGNLIWRNWNFMPSSHGIFGGEQIGNDLRFEISNGAYTFRVTVFRRVDNAVTTA